MQDIAPGHPDTEFASHVVLKSNLEKILASWEEDEKKKIHITPVSGTLPQQITEDPVFLNPVVDSLYENGLYIGEALINEILELPRQSLVYDLELILNDLLSRYEFFRQEVDEEGWDEDLMSFPIHAVMLLAELRAEESLPKLLEVLRQDEDFLGFWFDDHLTETIWEAIYHIGNNQLDVLKQFVQEPGLYTYVKTAVSRAVGQINYHQPERKEEVVQWYSDVLDFFNSSIFDDNVIDTEVIGLIIWEVIDLRYDKLLPVIKDLYSKQYVPEGMTGDYRSVERDIKKAQRYPHKEDLLNMADRYKRITTTWAGYREENEPFLGKDVDDDFNFKNFPISEPVQTAPKIGRNEPCPCGSGKKYKKCCMDKTNT
jgi:hypothetical protein